MSTDISLADLDVELLPERQTMFVFSFNPVVAVNSAEAVQAVTLLSLNNAAAVQSVTVIG